MVLKLAHKNGKLLHRSGKLTCVCCEPRQVVPCEDWASEITGLGSPMQFSADCTVSPCSTDNWTNWLIPANSETDPRTFQTWDRQLECDPGGLIEVVFACEPTTLEHDYKLFVRVSPSSFGRTTYAEYLDGSIDLLHVNVDADGKLHLRALARLHKLNPYEYTGCDMMMVVGNPP